MYRTAAPRGLKTLVVGISLAAVSCVSPETKAEIEETKRETRLVKGELSDLNEQLSILTQKLEGLSEDDPAVEELETEISSLRSSIMDTTSELETLKAKKTALDQKAEEEKSAGRAKVGSVLGQFAGTAESLGGIYGLLAGMALRVGAAFLVGKKETANA